MDSSSGVGGSPKVKGKRSKEKLNNLKHVENNTTPAYIEKEVSSLKLDDHSPTLFDQD